MTDPIADFDGCHRECRKAGKHTLRWGGCEHAPEPEPSITIMRARTASDGYPELVGERSTVTELADHIETALRTVPIRLTNLSLRLLSEGREMHLTEDEYAAMARAVATALATPADPKDQP